MTGPGKPLPRVDFIPEATTCPTCGRPLKVYRTESRRVSTLAHGRFEARERQLRCDRGVPERRQGCPTMRSDELSLLVPPRQEFGYDLIDFVGRARYLEGKQREEIQAELKERGVQLSTGTISALCDRFLAHLERLHVLRSPALRAALSHGYALHIDATCDKGKGGHFLCIDGITGWVLQAARIDSESGDALAPVVDRTVELFGDPLAIMRDMGKGGAAAVHSLRERGVIDLICHQHFLRAVGNKLLGKPYDRLRTLLKGTALRSELLTLRKKLRPYQVEFGTEGDFGPGRVREGLSALVHWLIEGDGKATPSFPFALPHLQLVLRCGSLEEMVTTWMPRPWNQAERRAMRWLRVRVDRLKKDPRIGLAVAELTEGWRVFGELRSVLRLTSSELPGSSRGGRQLPVATAELLRLHEIEMSVRQYMQELEERAGAEADNKRTIRPEAIVLRYLRAQRKRLFGHPAIRAEDGRIVAVVERTNNIIEHRFGGEKQRLRKRLGRADLGRDLQQQPAQAMLVSNLRDSRYVEILCGSLANLPAAFARLDRDQVAQVQLTRDHRDSHLDRLVREMLRREPGVAGAGRLPPPGGVNRGQCNGRLTP